MAREWQKTEPTRHVAYRIRSQICGGCPCARCGTCSFCHARIQEVTVQEAGPSLELSRRKLLAAAGVGSGALVMASHLVVGKAQAASVSGKFPEPAGTPSVAGLHLQFGADASSEVTVSWHTLQPVRNPRVVPGRPDGKLEQTKDAKPTSYTDGKSSRQRGRHDARR